MPRILDGALGTELARAGHDISGALWSARLLVDQPQAITDVHRAYFDAGADVVTTASYQASFSGFAAHGLGADDTRALLVRSVSLARDAERAHHEARAAGGLGARVTQVAASVGPYGATLADGSEYTGAYGLTVNDLFDFHRERLAVLWSAEPDLLACETIPSRVEAEAIVRALRAVPGARAWVSFQCRDGAHTAAGDPIADVARLLDAEPQVVAIGVNCVPPDRVLPLVRAIRSATAKPVVAYPNSGEVWDAVGRRWLGAPDGHTLASAANTWVSAGADWIGGCCRSTPADIAALAGCGLSGTVRY